VNVHLKPDYAYTFGVGLMGDVAAMTLIDFTGRVCGSRRMASTSMQRGSVLAKLRRFRKELLSELRIDPGKLIGAGVALSAFFTGEGGQMAGPPSLEDWTRVELEPILREALELPVLLENDGAAAAVAESRYGLGLEFRDFVYLHLTNGFGGGIISGGRLFRGHRGNAGEFGGIWTVNGLDYPSLDALHGHVRNAGQHFETVEHMLGAITPETPGVEAWLRMAQKPFEQLCGVLAYALDPQAIVIGGRVPSAIAQQLVQRLDIPRAPNRHRLAPPLPALYAARAPGDAVTLGAALLPLQRMFFVH
jgi:predicted NBD/HSP70 family sugar kinase